MWIMSLACPAMGTKTRTMAYSFFHSMRFRKEKRLARQCGNHVDDVVEVSEVDAPPSAILGQLGALGI